MIGVLIWMALGPGELERHLARLRAEGIPTTLEELDTWYVAVPDAENAGELSLAAASGLRTVSVPGLELSFSRRATRTNAPTAEVLAGNRAYLATNASTLAAIHAALTHPRSRYRVNLRGGVMTTLPHLGSLKPCVEQLCVCAEIAAEAGQSELATQSLLDGLRLSRTLEQEPMLISFLVMTACEAITATSAGRVLRHVSLNEDDLHALQKAFGEAAVGLSYGRAMVGELCITRDALRNPGQVLFRGASSAGKTGSIPRAEEIGVWLYSATGLMDRDMRIMLDYYDRSRSNATLTATKRRIETQRLNTEVTGRLSSEYLPVARMMLPGIFQMETKASRQYARLRCVEVACAVERWRLAHSGVLPSSLDALVPEFLSAIPEDPMDGRPLKFRPLAKGFVVYGVGEDGVDDHGTVYVPGVTKQWDDTFVVER